MASSTADCSDSAAQASVAECSFGAKGADPCFRSQAWKDATWFSAVSRAARPFQRSESVVRTMTE